jgi:hypothetical protein
MARLIQFEMNSRALPFIGALVFTITAGSLLWLSAIYALYQILGR